MVVAIFTCGLHLAAPLSSRLLLSSRPSRRARNQINRHSNSHSSWAKAMGCRENTLDLNVRTRRISRSSDTVPVSSLQDRFLVSNILSHFLSLVSYMNISGMWYVLVPYPPISSLISFVWLATWTSMGCDMCLCHLHRCRPPLGFSLIYLTALYHSS